MMNSVSVEALLRWGCEIKVRWGSNLTYALDRRGILVASTSSLIKGDHLLCRDLGQYRPLLRVKARSAPP